MRTELVSIPTGAAPLDGAFHRPDGGPAAGAALIFHGNTMNFYVGPPRFLPPALMRLGLACLAFNRRGHDILSTRDSREAEGAAFQLTAEAIADNRLAAAWLAERGFPNPVVIGHSNGGMLAVRHVADHPETPALVLLSAHMGGPKLVERASRTGRSTNGPTMRCGTFEPSAILINTSRGHVLDEAALERALQEGRIRGAGLDVYETEVPEPDPGPRKGLTSVPNVVFTPHIGSAARETREEMALRTVRNIELFLAGERPLDVLNPDVYGEAAIEDERIG